MRRHVAQPNSTIPATRHALPIRIFTTGHELFPRQGPLEGGAEPRTGSRAAVRAAVVLDVDFHPSSRSSMGICGVPMTIRVRAEGLRRGTSAIVNSHLHLAPCAWLDCLGGFVPPLRRLPDRIQRASAGFREVGDGRMWVAPGPSWSSSRQGASRQRRVRRRQPEGRQGRETFRVQILCGGVLVLSCAGASAESQFRGSESPLS